MTKKFLLNAAIFAAFGLMALFCTSLSGCKADEETPVSDNSLRIAQETLNDTIVFYAKAMMGTTDLTKLDGGCPVKFYFSWKEIGDTLTLKIPDFHVGRMPFHLSFSIDLTFLNSNDWEKEEYPGDGWIKFTGDGGVSTFGEQKSERGTVTGYFNTETKEITLETVFNLAGVTLNVYQQETDYDRLKSYDEDLAKYQQALWNAQQGS
jgi:hypothetical protein